MPQPVATAIHFSSVMPTWIYNFIMTFEHSVWGAVCVKIVFVLFTTDLNGYIHLQQIYIKDLQQIVASLTKV